MDTITHNKACTTFSGPKAVNVFACFTVATALKMYAKTGIRANRAYTPSRMLAFVQQQTGKRFKRTQYLEAADYLVDWAKAQRATIPETREP